VKIGFLALSGIRAHDPELLELGLTLPGFVERSQQIAALPSLGLLYLAAATPEGHELAYFEAPRAGDVSDELLGCDLVAISTFSAQIREAYAIADRLRAAGVRRRDRRLARDRAARGGAAGTPTHVVDRRGRARLAGVSCARRNAKRGRTDLAMRASSRRSTSRRCRCRATTCSARDRTTASRVQTSRGCPWRCEFCASSVMLSERYRRRPVEHVVRDVRAVLALRPDAFIELADDNTFVDKRWGKELCRAPRSARHQVVHGDRRQRRGRPRAASTCSPRAVVASC
jgi:hypothetical protein